MVSRRTFLRTAAATPLAGCLGCASPGPDAPREADVLTAGFEGFATALAYARTRVGEDVDTRLHVQEDRLLAAWDDDRRIRIVETGHVVDGGWRLTTRGICMEFMLRMEIRGPIASSPHPRPGRPWEPELRVGDARALMRRMLEEGGVGLVFGSARAAGFRMAQDTVPGGEFTKGQRIGTAAALAAQSGESVADVLEGARLRDRLARDFALPG